MSCAQAGCHAQTPIACTTCHGSYGTPRPDAGAHWAHQAYCSTCHNVPVETVASVQEHASQDASTLVHFNGLPLQSAEDWLMDGGAGPGEAADGGSPLYSFDAGPAWNASALQCTNTYCHGPVSPQWTSPVQIQCTGCHDAPPPNHARWLRVATGVDSCATCHPDPTGPTHVNGVVDVTVTSCTTCHGSDDHPNPPLSLSGSTDPTTRGVGAHEAHLDPNFPGRFGKPLLCNDCHVVPSTVVQPGHFDQPVTQVRFSFGGAYDQDAGTCNVWCHYDKTPGPSWTDNTGDVLQCNSCHAFPPVLTRSGDPHPSVPGELSECVRCHLWGVSTHVNGVVDFVGP